MNASPARMPAALAVAAHPDDIEFVMAGTLLLLRAAGWQVHYVNLSNGDLGSLVTRPAETARVRRREAQAAAQVLDAVWYPPVCRDLQVFYDDRTIRRVAAVIREADPTVILTHSPQDYMEDHMNASRLAVSAAFVRGMPGYRTIPARRAVSGPVTIYHANPHGQQDQLRRRVAAGAYVDTSSVHEQKRRALECHASQRGFLDETQRMDDYVRTMEQFSLQMGRLSGRFRHAEGWRRHLHFGFCEEGDDPLREALARRYLIDERYERDLQG